MRKFKVGDRVFSSMYGDWGVVRGVQNEGDGVFGRYIINFERPCIDGYWIQNGYYAMPDELTTEEPERQYYLASPIFLEGD